MVALVRFWVVRGLNVPLFGDSVHHAMIAQLLVDNGGIFQSWAPYADLHSLTYHFGFHSFTALYSWLTNLPVPKAMVLVGQVINILAVFCLYPLAKKVGRGAWAGSAALLIAGLVSSFPMFYTNWGRYTQVAGQAMLPVLVWLAWEATEGYSRSVRAWILIGVVWTSLALTHYRIFLLGLLFLLILLIWFIAQKPRLQYFVGYLTAGLTGAILLAPWLINVYGGKLMSDLTSKITPTAAAGDVWEQYNVMPSFLDFHPFILWLLFILIFAWAVWKHDRGGVWVGWWAFLALVATNPAWFGLTGSGIISNFALLIMAYFWISLMIAAGLGYVLEKLRIARSAPLALQAALFVVVLLVGAYFVPEREDDLQRANYQLFTRADERAAGWMKENTSPDARFLVNFHFGYSNSVLAGSDGGWWLPLLAGRGTMTPPMIYTVEKGPYPGYIAWVQPAGILPRKGNDLNGMPCSH